MPPREANCRATRKGRACGQAAVQDRYLGDVGDFGKYGLLRALCAVEPTWGTLTYDLSLGVI